MPPSKNQKSDLEQIATTKDKKYLCAWIFSSFFCKYNIISGNYVSFKQVINNSIHIKSCGLGTYPDHCFMWGRLWQYVKCQVFLEMSIRFCASPKIQQLFPKKIPKSTMSCHFHKTKYSCLFPCPSPRVNFLLFLSDFPVLIDFTPLLSMFYRFSVLKWMECRVLGDRFQDFILLIMHKNFCNTF